MKVNWFKWLRMALDPRAIDMHKIFQEIEAFFFSTVCESFYFQILEIFFSIKFYIIFYFKFLPDLYFQAEILPLRQGAHSF